MRTKGLHCPVGGQEIGSSAKPPNSNSAMARPTRLASTAQPPPIVARLAMAAKDRAMPISKGRPLLTNGRSARAKTKGSTGRMHGLKMVRTPPR
jgi:hypothetical protein